MASDNLSIIEICRRELERLRNLAAEYRGVLLPAPERVRICRDRAEATRILAERAEDPRAKHLLLEIAYAYDRFPCVSSWDICPFPSAGERENAALAFRGEAQNLRGLSSPTVLLFTNDDYYGRVSDYTGYCVEFEPSW